jgi:ribosomal protein L16/L10AE
MEHNIFSSNIITNFEHVVRGRLVHDDFLVVVADYWEAAQFMGGLYVDEKSMIGLVQWARGLEEGPDTLLISIDGKYGAVAKMSDLRNAKSGYEWVYIGDIWAPVNRVKAEVQRLLVDQPEEARKLNLRAFQKAVPARIKFLPGGPLRPGWVSGEIHEAIRNIEGATDDALVWILMLGVTENLGLSEEVLERATREVKMRIDKGSEFRSTFFPLNAVTMKEIEARTRRAKRDRASFLTKFPSERDLNLDESQLNERFRRVEQYAARLSNDRLIELTVFLYNKEDWLGATFKHFLGEFDKRVARAGD